MADLLPDNLELSRRSQSEVQRNLTCISKSPKKRELSEDWKGLLAWSVSFSTFIAVVTSKYPGKAQELLAYHTTLLIEALRFGCKGWLSYDRMFREHVEKEPHSSWAMLHPMFYSLTFLRQRVEALTCSTCMTPDRQSVPWPRWSRLVKYHLVVGRQRALDKMRHREGDSVAKVLPRHKHLALRQEEPLYVSLTTKGNASAIPSRVIVNTGAFGVGRSTG